MNFRFFLIQSLHHQLAICLSAIILLIALVTAYMSYSAELENALEVQNHHLTHIAQSLDPKSITEDSSEVLKKVASEQLDDKIIVQQLDPNRVFQRAEPYLPTNLSDGLQALTIHGTPFRMYVKTFSPEIKLAIFQKANSIHKIAFREAMRTFLSVLAALPFSIFFLYVFIKGRFKTIKQMANDVRDSVEKGVKPIVDTQIPEEVRPFVYSVNQVLVKVSNTISAQRRFVADAAHELRSSLASVMIQVDHLDSEELSEVSKRKVISLKARIKRASDFQNQLITYARLHDSDHPKGKSVAVLSIFRRVIEDMIPLAEEKNINISVIGYDDILIDVSELDLLLLVKNLVDNAIRFTPQNGKIKLSIFYWYGQYIIEVSDNGPGIAETEREMVFEPYYRIPGNGQTGTGLGLSIVKNIVIRNRANIQIKYTDEVAKTGLTVWVIFSSSEHFDGVMNKGHLTS